MSVHLHLDLVGGMAGDMTVAALLDAGVDADELLGRLSASGLPVTTLDVTRTRRGGLEGTHVKVPPEQDPPARHWREIRELLDGSALTERARDRALDVFGRLAAAEAATGGPAFVVEASDGVA